MVGHADGGAATELHPFGEQLGEAAVEHAFSIFELGDPVAQSHPGTFGALEDDHIVAARVSCWAHARPAGPDPTTATRRPVRSRGSCGFTQPSAKARSAISYSIRSMVTGSALMPSTQAPSQARGTDGR